MSKANERWPIPQSWEWVTIDQIGKITGGGTPSSKDTTNFKSPGNGIPWITPADLTGYKDTYISGGRRDLSVKGLNSCGAQLLPKGSVLFTSRAPVGYCAIAKNEIATNQGFKSVTPPSWIDSKFLRYYLLASKDYAESKASGSTFLELSGKRMAELLSPVPPANEQKRIVKKLETCEARIEAAREALSDVPQLLEHYRQSVLAAAFRGDLTAKWRTQNPEVESAEKLLERLRHERRQRWEQAELAKYEAKGKAPPKDWKKKYKAPEPLTKAQIDELPELPEGWCWAKCEEISMRVTVGHVGSMKQEYRPKGIPFLRGQNVRENQFQEKGLLYISDEFHESLAKSKLTPGDIVVTRSGDVGTACVIPKSLKEANCSDLVIIQNPLLVSAEVITYYINSGGKSAINKGKVGVAITHFNTKSVAELPIPLPPLKEQDQIVEKLNQLDQKCRTIREVQIGEIKALSALTQSLLAKAFHGELVPQDPNDEPASKLLERIAEERQQKTEAKVSTKSKKREKQ